MDSALALNVKNTPRHGTVSYQDMFASLRLVLPCGLITAAIHLSILSFFQMTVPINRRPHLQANLRNHVFYQSQCMQMLSRIRLRLCEDP